MPDIPQEDLAGLFIPLAQNYVMMLVSKEHSSGTQTSGCGSSIAGHGILLIHTALRYKGSHYFMFHLRGWGGGSSGNGSSDSSIIASSINIHPQVNHFIDGVTAGGAPTISGTATHTDTYTLSEFNIISYISFKNRMHDANPLYKPVIVHTDPFPIDDLPAQLLINACIMSEYDPNVYFSLIGGAVNFGENCVTWIYNQLGMIGVGFDNRLYYYSFLSP